MARLPRPAGRGNAWKGIDHVVVGPSGTFTLSARELTGKVWVGARSVRHNGHPTNFLSKAVCHANHVSEFLSSVVGRPIEVRGVLWTLADEWTIDEEPADVHVGEPARGEGLDAAAPPLARTSRDPRDHGGGTHVVDVERTRMHATRMNPRRRRGFIRSGRTAPEYAAVLGPARHPDLADRARISVPVREGRQVEWLPTGDGVQPPEAGHPVQRPSATVLEADPRTRPPHRERWP